MATNSSRSEIQYNQILQRLVNSVKRDIDEQLVPVIEAQAPNYVRDSWGDDIQAAGKKLQDKWTSPGFVQAAERIATGFIRVTLSAIDRQNKRSFGIDVLQASPKLRMSMQAAAIQNANLIQSIPGQYLRDVANTVFSNMRMGLLPAEIAKQLEDDHGVAQRRARFIARDQTAKVHGDLSEQRQRDAGYEFFEWMDSDDERVRSSHRAIAEADVGYGPGVYRWDDLPTNERGEKVKPGSDYQCRCGARPISNAKVRRNQEAARRKEKDT
jgi:SPP1 gp7 family putative phage head morphogenesis protein